MQLTVFDYLPQAERDWVICSNLFETGRKPRMVSGQVRMLPQKVMERIQAEPIPVEPPSAEDVCLKQTPEDSTPVSSSSVIQKFAKPRRAGKGKVHLVKPGDERALCHFRPGYSSGGWTDSDVQPNCPRCIKESAVLTPAPEKDVQKLELEAAELRAKLQDVKTIRVKQKQVEELKNTRAQISKKISEIMGRGHSRLNDEEAAHFQKKYDRASQAIRALEDEIPGIIPATWRWEERLAEIEQALGLSKEGQA